MLIILQVWGSEAQDGSHWAKLKVWKASGGPGGTLSLPFPGSGDNLHVLAYYDVSIFTGSNSGPGLSQTATCWLWLSCLTLPHFLRSLVIRAYQII